MEMEQWARVRRKILVEKQSKRSVMSEEGLHWETLQKMLAHSRPPGYRRGGKRSRKIDAHVEWVRGVLDRDQEVPRKQRHTAKRIFDRLRIERGYEGGYTAVKELVAETHLATALGFAACAQGKRVRHWGATELVTHMLEMREARDLKRFLLQIGKHDLIVLDELGYVPFSKAGAELLFEVVSRAYERLSLIVSTNLPFEQWTEVMGSERLTGAMLDRLTHRVNIIEANGESYRLKDARKRRKRPKGG